MSHQELLWADAQVYQRRLEKSAVALIAIQRALSENRRLVPGVEEFLRLYEFLARADPHQFAKVWIDPSAYFWIRRAVHFLAGCRGEPLGTVEREYCKSIGAKSVQEALVHHLGEFKRFALGIAIISGTDCSFEEPYDVAVPMSIPGTPLVLSGGSHASIAGYSGGVIKTISPSQLISVKQLESSIGNGLHVERCPTIRCDNVEVFLNPATFRLPGIDIAREWTELPLSFQLEHVPLVTEAFSAIRRFQPWTFSHFSTGLHTIAVKPYDELLVNASASELPGAFVCSVPIDPYALAGSFIHEFHHNTLFSLEEEGPFFEPSEEDVVEGENHYSPWVDTLRPLHGILHAVYVFLPVFSFWHAIVSDGSLDETRNEFGRDQLARIPAQLRIGVNQLRRHSRLTKLGEKLVDAMENEIRLAEQQAGACGAAMKTPAMGITRKGALRRLMRAGRPVTVVETLLEHLETRDILGECAEEKALLRLALNS